MATDDAFHAYKQQLGRVVEEAMVQGQDYEARWAIVEQKMAHWSQQITAYVRDLLETRGQSWERVHEQQRDHVR
jgi:hypothetical protein